MCILTSKSFCTSCNTVTETQSTIRPCSSLQQLAQENPTIWRHPSVRSSHRGFRRTCPNITYNIHITNLDEHCRNEAIRDVITQRERELKRVEEALKTQERDRWGVPRRKTAFRRKMTRFFGGRDREGFLRDLAMAAAEGEKRTGMRRGSEGDDGEEVELLVPERKVELEKGKPMFQTVEWGCKPLTPPKGPLAVRNGVERRASAMSSPGVAEAPAPPPKMTLERQGSLRPGHGSTRTTSRIPSVHTLPAEHSGRRNAVSGSSSSRSPPSSWRYRNGMPSVHTLSAEQARRQDTAQVSSSPPESQRQLSSTHSPTRVPSVHTLPAEQRSRRNSTPAPSSEKTYVPYQPPANNWI